MRLIPKSEDWTAYAWVIYLLYFLLAGALYFRSYWIRGPRVLWIAAAWFVLGVIFLRVNPGASVFFVYAACLYGKIWEPPVAFRYLAGHVALAGLVCWALGTNMYASASAVV